MRRSTQIIRRTLPIAISIVVVTWLAPLSAKQSDAPLRQDGVTLGPWTVRQTDHFDIYYQSGQESRLNEVAREAERAYLRISMDLEHTLTKQVPLILLQTNRDLPQHPGEAYTIVRASGAPDGVDHMMLSLESFSTRVTHELTHQFEFDLIPRPCRVPPWVLEGLADHETGNWISSERSAVRAKVAAGLVPAVAKFSTGDRLWGHALFDFIMAEYGTQVVRRYVLAACDHQTSGTEDARDAFDLASTVLSKEFDRAFLRYLRVKFN
jgi:hypothetical protein